MPKVGIMTEVSVEVYESVVVPAKGQKRFNRLVSQLLEAYYTSDKVRSIVDGEEALSNLEGFDDNYSIGSSDLEDFKREVLEGQKSFMDDMRSLMTDFMAMNSSKVVEEPVIVDKEPVIDTPKVAVEESKDKEVSPVVSPVVETHTAEPLPSLDGLDMDDLFDIEEEPEPKVQGLSGEDILNNLLGGGGNSFNFGGIQ